MLKPIVLVVFFSMLSNPPTSAQDSRLESLIARFETFSQAGDPAARARANDTTPTRWSNVTPVYIANRAKIASDMLAELKTLDTRSNKPEIAILRHLLQAEIDAHQFDTARIPLTGDWGFFAEPYYAATQTRLTTRQEVQAWIDRLNDTPRYFADNIVNMRRGITSAYTAHIDPLTTSIAQIRQQTLLEPMQSPLYTPFLSITEIMDEETGAEIQTSTIRAVTNALKAYQDLLHFMESEYLPAARTQPSIGSLAGGAAAYQSALKHHTAGAGYSAQQIHQLGLDEVARIRSEMIKIIDEVGMTSNFDDFINFLRTDRQFYARTPQELIEKAAEMSKRLDAILPRYFNILPRLTYGVEPVPTAIAPGYTTGRYSGGDLKMGIAGTYFVNTYRLNQRPLYELPALSAHEAVPGHHLQIALAQELEDVPNFRRAYYATAFGEGWALYAEKLAGEAGFYRTAYERFGQLSYEMWRACRLIVDTGLHYYGWSRAQAEVCFQQNTALSPLNIKTEITRYIGWPGQATAYKIGELKILKLRAAAKQALGEDFNIRDFHDHLLGAGAMPLDALEARMQAWIEGLSTQN